MTGKYNHTSIQLQNKKISSFFPTIVPSLNSKAFYRSNHIHIILFISTVTKASVAVAALTITMSSNDSQTFHWQDDDLDDDNFQIHGNTRLYILVLFSIVLLVTILFFLYSHCTERSHSSSTNNSSTYHTSPPSSQLQGLNASMINSLPITIHRQVNSVEQTNETTTTLECSICLGGFEEGDKVKVLPVCCHRYHCECVDKWLMAHSSCPICRTSVRVDSPV